MEAFSSHQCEEAALSGESCFFCVLNPALENAGLLTDGDVGVEEAWYFLGSYSCKQHSSPHLTWLCSRSSKLGDAEKGSESSAAVIRMKNACWQWGGLAKPTSTSAGVAAWCENPVLGSSWHSWPPTPATCGTSLQLVTAGVGHEFELKRSIKVGA